MELPIGCYMDVLLRKLVAQHKRTEAQKPQIAIKSTILRLQTHFQTIGQFMWNIVNIMTCASIRNLQD